MVRIHARQPIITSTALVFYKSGVLNPKPYKELILVGRRRGLASNPDRFRHSDELDKGLSLHLAHDLSAMHFDRDFTASQLTRSPTEVIKSVRA